jgi:S1-C subfamily serine protease
VGFAIPIDQAAGIAQEIISTCAATHAVLGASVTDTPRMASHAADGCVDCQLTGGEVRRRRV